MTLLLCILAIVWIANAVACILNEDFYDGFRDVLKFLGYEIGNFSKQDSRNLVFRILDLLFAISWFPAVLIAVGLKEMPAYFSELSIIAKRVFKPDARS